MGCGSSINKKDQNNPNNQEVVVDPIKKYI